MNDVDLVGWLRSALSAADQSTDLASQDLVDMVLSLAGEAAHNVIRPAAPLATFALGLAAAGNVTDLHVTAERIADAARSAGSQSGELS